MRKRAPVLASGPKEVAVLYLIHGRRSATWHYYPRNHSSQMSEGFKTQEAATKAAIKAGFKAIMLGNKVLVRV